MSAQLNYCGLPETPQLCWNEATASQSFPDAEELVYAMMCQHDKLSLEEPDQRMCLVAAKSLLASRPRHGLLLLVSESTVIEKHYQALLAQLNVQVTRFTSLWVPPEAHEHHRTAGTMNWVVAYQKLKIWSMTQFKKLVVLDSDVVVLDNLDFLFSLPGSAIGSDCTPHGIYHPGKYWVCARLALVGPPAWPAAFSLLHV